MCKERALFAGGHKNQRELSCLLMPLALAFSDVSEANGQKSPPDALTTIPCAVSSLKKLVASDRRKFDVRKEALTGFSSEGGTLTIMSANKKAQRVKAELFGETGKVEIDGAYVEGDLAVVVRWTEYVDSLPKVPVRTRRVDTQAGFICSGVVILDNDGRSKQGRLAEFQSLTQWLLSELKRRDMGWEAKLSRQ